MTPDELQEWLELIIEILGILIIVGAASLRFIRKPIVDMVNEFGTRVNNVDKSCTEHSVELGVFDKRVYEIEHDMKDLRGIHDRLEGHLSRLVESMDKVDDQKVKDDREIRDRLIRIESKLDLIPMTRKDT